MDADPLPDITAPAESSTARRELNFDIVIDDPKSVQDAWQAQVDSATTEVPNTAATTDIPLAYSDTDELDEQPPGRLERARAGLAYARPYLIMFAVAVVTAVAIVMLAEHGRSNPPRVNASPIRTSPPPATAKAAAPAAPPAPSAALAPPSTPAPPTGTPHLQDPQPSATERADNLYFQTLMEHNIGYASRAEAISDGHAACNAFDRGVTFGQLETASVNLGMSVKSADAYLAAAIAAYCPQYSGLVK